MPQRQVPGGAYLNEVGGLTAQLPGGAYVNEITLLEPRYGRPISTIAAGAWGYTGAASHHAAINEVTPSNTEYISVGEAGSIYKCALTAIGPDPGATRHVLSLIMATTSTTSARVKIMQGATTIATRDQAVTATPTQYDFELTGTERDNITDYTVLELWVEAL